MPTPSSTHRKLLLIISLFFLAITVQAQTDIIEIDTLNGTSLKGLPYNKSFTLKIAIDADDVDSIYFIDKYKFNDLKGSISHWIDKSKTNSFSPKQLPINYYNVRKVGEKNFLFINFANDYLLKPSTGYFIVIGLKKTSTAVNTFFDTYYKYGTEADPGKKDTLLRTAKESIREFNREVEKVLGKDLEFRYYADTSFVTDRAFDSTFKAVMFKPIKSYFDSFNKDTAAWKDSAAKLEKLAFNLDSITYKQLFRDTLVNKEALSFLTGRDMFLNNYNSDLNNTTVNKLFFDLLSGAFSLHAIFADRVNIGSLTAKDYAKRTANIDSSVSILNSLRRSLFLVRPLSPTSNISAAIADVDKLMSELLSAKRKILAQLKKRREIEALILKTEFSGRYFTLSAIASGNSYLNFETRNKVLLTPDFGLVTSAITKKGKDLEYGLIPYVGFHINFMAVDKDLSFRSYKKDWKQYLSFMVGWSLVNMNQSDSVYKNFFDKSSLLTGFGYRLGNVARVSAGTQWLFKTGTNSNNQPFRKLNIFPYVGISIDLNVKQYLNGFVDLLQGIGKTKAPEIKTK